MNPNPAHARFPARIRARATLGLGLLTTLLAGLFLMAAPNDRSQAATQGGVTCTNPPPFFDSSAPPELLKELMTSAPSLVSRLVTTNVVPGISVAVVYDQRIVFAMGAGCANIEMRFPAGRDTVYRIESVTKLFESTMMMQQRDAGKYQTWDAVASYVPEVFYPYEVPRRGIKSTWYPSFLELASHTSGLPDPVPVASGTPSQQIAKFWSNLNGVTVTLPRKYSYSDYGNVAMSQAVALIAGYTNNGTNEAFHQYVEDKIFQPLGMSASTFDHQTVPPQKLAIPYLKTGQPWTPDPNGFNFGLPIDGKPFIRMALMPELGSTRLLAQIVGLGNATEMCLTGRFVEAEEALRMGLVSQVVPGDQLLDAALAKAAEIATNPTAAVMLIKELLAKNPSEPDLEAVMEREQVRDEAARRLPDHREAIDAFREKREARFNQAPIG